MNSGNNNHTDLSEQVKEENIKVEPDITYSDAAADVPDQYYKAFEYQKSEDTFPDHVVKNEEDKISNIDLKKTVDETETNGFSCSFCAKHFKLLYYLDRHLVKHTGEKKYQCDECPQLFAYKQDIPRHKKMHRSDRVLLKCTEPSCGKSFTTKHALYVHLESHGEDFVCDHCGQTFVTKQRLKTHTVKIHTKEFSLFCDKCGKGYLDKERNRGFKNHTEKCGLKDTASIFMGYE